MAVVQPDLKTDPRANDRTVLRSLLSRIARRPSGDDIRGGALAAAAFAIPLASYAGCQTIAPMAALWGLLGVSIWRRLTLNTGALILLALVLTAVAGAQASPYPWAHLTGPWSLGRQTPFKLVLQWALYGLAVASVAQAPPVWARRACWALVAGLGLAMAADIFDMASGQLMLRALKGLAADEALARHIPLMVRLGQSSFVLTALFWPAAAFLARRSQWVAIGAWLALLMLLAVRTDMNAPVLAIAISGLVYLAARLSLRLCAIALAAGATVYFLAAPWLVQLAIHTGLFARIGPHLPASWSARLTIWSFVSDRIAEHPLLGRGIDASRTFPGVIPLHPHDGALQLWLELGAIGACLAAAFWVWLTAAVVRQDRRSPGFGAVGLATASVYLLIGSISFGIWQEWWLATGALAFAACLALVRERTPIRMLLVGGKRAGKVNPTQVVARA